MSADTLPRIRSNFQMGGASMPGLRLLPLGVGNAFSAVSYSTCLALEADGCWLLIDCPHPIRKMMREASATAAVDLDAAAVHAIVLTHLHADHVSGLEGLAFYSRFLLDRKLRLHGTPQRLRASLERAPGRQHAAGEAGPGPAGNRVSL